MPIIQLTGVHLAGGIRPDGETYKHITLIKWKNETVKFDFGYSTREAFARWLADDPNSRRAYVVDPATGKRAWAFPHPDEKPFFVHTEPDDTKHDNLLEQDRTWKPENFVEKLPMDREIGWSEALGISRAQSH